MLRTALLALLVSLAFAAPAQKVYKWVMPDGSVRFSDRPQEEGAVEGGEIQVQVTPPSGGGGGAAPAEDAEAPADEASEEFAGYESLAIVSPTNGEAIRDNGGNVSVQMTLEPALQEGHVIEIFMDGASIGTGRTTGLTLTNVDRGSHTLQARVRDESGNQVIASGAVTFNLLRVAVGG